MAVTFKEVRKLQGERVRMLFEDGRETVAVLLSATKDVDGSKHLIYDRVESCSGAETSVVGGCFYADARTLVDIRLAEADRVTRRPSGWDYVGIRPCARPLLSKQITQQFR